MTIYRENAARTEATQPVAFSRHGPVVRWTLTALVAAAAVFFGVMAVLVSMDSWLRCTRAVAGADASCVLHEDYPAGITVRTPLPVVRRAETARRVRSGRGGSRRATVLVLVHIDGTTTEFPGVGKSGARADAVAQSLSAYLAGDETVARSWHLRESAVPVAVILLLVAFGGLALTPAFFQKTRVWYEPRDRRVVLRVGRWPGRARVWSHPLDAIARVERTVTHDRNGPAFSVRLVRDDGAPGIDRGNLGLALRKSDAADAVVRALEAALARWRSS